MDTYQITSILKYREPATSTTFIGTYAGDKIPSSRKKKVQAYVVNTENANKSGKHWILIILKNNVGYYFDSYGQRPTNINTLNYLNKNSIKWTYNTIKLQEEYT